MLHEFRRQIKTFERRLKNSEDPLELCWCLHELARFNIEIKKWELARVYSRKCVQDATAISDWEWAVNATMLLAKIYIQQHNRNDARSEIISALGMADQLKDENLKLYLERVLGVIEKVEFDDIYGPQVLEKREKKILSMINNDKMKNEFAYLFRMMAAMPASRRMTVMPGIRVDKLAGKKASINKRMSIMPTAEMRESGGPKKQDPKEVDFMKLVQFHL
ncbi:hypothetical protein JTB14_032832 [Gonioctena quinquepunctata]|nr:hypothetical protein JTB14_032832 [Gonioctena quinquepunctata]